VSVVQSDQQLVFDRVYAHLHETGEWPRSDELQRQLATEQQDVSVRAVVMEARDFAAFDSPDQRVRLNLRGLSVVPQARPLLEAYLLAVRAMLHRYRNPNVEARYSADDLAELELDPVTERELSRLLTEDHWPLGSGGAPPEGPWSYEISEVVVAASRVTTVDELVRVRYGGPVSNGQESGGPAPEPPITEPGRAPTVYADEPITDPRDDLLGRVRLAEALAARATAPLSGQGFVMGVSGAWGSGKTSLLNLIAANVQAAGTGYLVRFDPWLFSSSEELVLRFLREMAVQLRGEPRLGEVASRIGDYAQILAPLTALSPAPWLAPAVSAGGGLLKRWRKREPVSAEQQRDAVREALRKLDRRVVVLIDDLDRLQAAEIRDVVRLVKLVGDFPNTTYLLAYDQARVARALGERNEQEGQEFLEKIVQLSHDVPPVAPEMLSGLLVDAISRAVGDLTRYHFDENAYRNVFVDGLGALFTTVRDVRRYANVLPATLALVGDEVELADILTLEALRVRVPTSFALIIASKQALTEVHDSLSATPASNAIAAQQIAAIVEAAGGFGEEVAAIVRRLFPAAQRHLGGSSYGSTWRGAWRRNRRVAHPEVFDIYVNKTLASGMLPAALVDRAFNSLQDREALFGLLDTLDSDGLASLLERLEHYEQDFPTEDAEVSVSVLYAHRGRLREAKRHVMDLGAGHHVSRVVLRILRKLDRPEASRVTRTALENIDAFSDRGELVRLVGYREDSGHQLVSEEDAVQIEAAFFDQLLAADLVQLGGERDLLQLLLWTHSQRPQETASLVERLVADDELLARLLRSALGEVVGETSGDATVRRSFRLSWRALTVLVPEARLAERIKQLDVARVRDNADERTLLAVQEGLRYANDPTAADRDQRSFG
jgi:hypothetical protein